ncbi:MAG: hypothetical protein QOJ42_1721, partial [Acidobacteriaceae bacterium]|nr:hypothetical protein [Acidobacteriaceae bacterium]
MVLDVLHTPPAGLSPGFPWVEASPAATVALHRAQNLEDQMKTIVVMLSLIALATTAQAGQRSSLEKDCRALVGKEEPEGTDGKSHLGQLNVQR